MIYKILITETQRMTVEIEKCECAEEDEESDEERERLCNGCGKTFGEWDGIPFSDGIFLCCDCAESDLVNTYLDKR